MSPDSRQTAIIAQVEQEVAAPLADLGMDLEEVELTPAGKRRLLRIAVDKDGGVTLDDVAEATRVVSAVLDDPASTVMGQQPYTLEVTSRGVHRPLALPRHWRRNAGRLVTITPTEGDQVTGRIVGSDDEQVRLEVPGQSGEQTLAYDGIRRAVVEIEFNRSTQED